MRRAGLAIAVVVLAALAAGQPASAALQVEGIFGGRGSGDGQFNSARGVAVAPNGDVLVVDGNQDRIQRFSADGTFLSKFGARGGGNGQTNSPQGIAVDAAGNIFVADTGNYRVQKFGPNGTFIQVIGQFGTGPGDFHSNTHDVAVDDSGNLYVSERGDRILKFTNGGQFITAWGSTGSNDGQFDRPTGIAWSGASLWVADQNNSRVQEFDAAGQLLRRFGVRGNAEGQLQQPADVALVGGNVLVADDNRTLQLFDPSGTFLTSLPSSAAPGGSFRPFGLAVAPSGQIYMTDVEVNIGDRVFRLRQVPDAPPPPPSPEFRRSVAVEVVTGEVLVKPAGSDTFQPLEQPGLIAVRSSVDVSKGTVRMTAARNAAGDTQKGDFSGGRFKVAKLAANGLTDLRLEGGSFRRCPRNVARRGARPAARRIRRLRSNARGRFRTRGRYSSATVRGTDWTMEDRCDGTMTIVRKGRVVVRDFARRRNVVVRKGRRYLARPRRR